MSELITLSESSLFLNARKLSRWNFRHLWIIIVEKTHINLPIHTLCLSLQETGCGWLHWVTGHVSLFGMEVPEWCVMKCGIHLSGKWHSLLFCLFIFLLCHQLLPNLIPKPSLLELKLTSVFKIFHLWQQQTSQVPGIIINYFLYAASASTNMFIPCTISIPRSFLFHVPKMLYSDLPLYRFKSFLIF